MKMKRLLTSFGISTVVAVVVLLLLNNKTEQNYTPRDIISADAEGMVSWLNTQRANAKTGIIDLDYAKSIEGILAAQHNAKNSNGFDFIWKEMGPDKVGGRTRSILIDKTDNAIMYAGSVTGGLWKTTDGAQTWKSVDDAAANMVVTSICQTENNNIYYGTGEASGSKFHGNGISYSTDGKTFNVISSTSAITFVNKLVSHSNKVYAATNMGLYSFSADGSDFNLISDAGNCLDVEIDKNGIIYTVIDSIALQSTNGTVFNKIDSLSNQNLLNVKFAVSEKNTNYVYCSIVYSTTENTFGTDYQDFDIFKSIDKGVTWTSIRENYVASFQPFKKQGDYNNVLKVLPNDEETILLGGIDLYKYTPTSKWHQMSINIGSSVYESAYMHADLHSIVFHPDFDGDSNEIIYFGNDGGVYRTENAGQTFKSTNLKYNVTQFYSVSANRKGQWLAGAQDNGTQYNDMEGINKMRTESVSGGDGFDCIIPIMNPDIKIITTRNEQESWMYRITSEGDINDKMYKADNIFPPSIAIWESFYDAKSIDSAIYMFDEVGSAVGDTIIAYSPQGRNRLPYVLTITDSINTNNFQVESEVKVWDHYQSLFAFSDKSGIWMSSRVVNQSKTTLAEKKVSSIGELEIDDISYGMGQNLVFSKDGDHLFFSVYNKIYRLSNLLDARISEGDENITIISPSLVTTQVIGELPEDYYVTSITTDPEVSNNIVITVGGFGNHPHIYFSANAATTVSTELNTNFVNISGNLPGIPVYTSIIAWNDSRKVMVGTERGLYSTNDMTGASITWSLQSDFPNIAVTDLYQQTVQNGWINGVINHGYVYAATFGRGVFMSKSNAGPVSVKEITSSNSKENKISLYPNPANNIANVKINLEKYSDINISVYSISGQKVFANKYNGVKGDNIVTINTSTFKNGVYFVRVNSNNYSEVVKLIVK